MVSKWLIGLLGVTSVSFAAQDPTAPLNWQVSTQKAPTAKVTRVNVPNLQSIVCGSQLECVAILNGKALSEGEKLNGFNIQRIDSEYVMLTRGKKHWKLELFPQNIKQQQ
ncbi:MSHA biogenesis protein MshK [Vibrio sinensis]|uniref:MSHA biogenesis protein MshK n=1 Tax=Vibrio sinensis TaxID=2302434 RepID=A0A3A6QIM4_9VIBR|nr:MSHA biogenesis protein MshK [Vibrio sinensis]RJX70676.1 MSHA biogenesis protein MshK [Vibrio sinensis]